MRTYTLIGKGPEVSVKFAPGVDLSNDVYEIALVHLSTVHTIRNVKDGHNRLHYEVVEGDGAPASYMLSISPGTYTLEDIHHRISNNLHQQFPSDFAEKKHFFELEADPQTNKVRVNTSFTLRFDHAESIGPLLGFSKTVSPTPFGVYVAADAAPTIVKDFEVFVTCNVIESGYINHRIAHVLYQFHVNDLPAAIVEERPAEKIFHRVTRRWIDEISIRLENADGHLIPLYSETPLTCTLLVRPRSNYNGAFF
ncbi:hypothetical protein R5R35_013828 [Gryllus longicercus]|uniref:Uncharacterized protein n=1 Tax=Gryllus longicercus TaxID=2509291 RepID=A0AAN9YV68_9ORTH